MKKIQLAYIVSTLGRTGPTRQLLNILRHLDRNQFEPHLITLSNNPRDNLEGEFLALGIEVYPLNLSRLTTSLLGGRRLADLCERLRPDLLHTQGLRADWLSARNRGIRSRVSTQRNDPYIDYPSLMGQWSGRMAAYLHQHALDRIPVLVTCSNAISQNYSRSDRTVRIIHNGVELSKPNPHLGWPERAAKRRKLHLPEHADLFVFAGPLIPRKRPGFLIKAFRGLKDGSRGLVILGDGPLMKECRALSQNLPNIFLLGQMPAIDDYLQIADCFISASVSEGLPNAVLEALSANVPALLSDIPAHREVLGYSSLAGWLFPTNCPHSLARTISSLKIEDENRKAARQLVCDHFDAVEMSRAYQKLYLEQVAASSKA
jgi:glycosyltransferase involved in cell wall biosynthesis